MTAPDASRSNDESLAERLSRAVSRWVGSSPAFAIAALSVLVWALTGPLFGYSVGWQMVINTGTTIVTFLMVFLIQRSQNRESLAVQLKLNEIVAALDGASNRLLDVEDVSETELSHLHEYYRQLAERVKHEANRRKVHSLDEAAGDGPGRRRAGPIAPEKPPARE